MYSLGIVLWELATGEVPYAGVEEHVVRTSVKAGERLDVPSDVPAHFRDWIAQCTAQSAQQRPTCLQLLRAMQAVKEAQDDEKVAAGVVATGAVSVSVMATAVVSPSASSSSSSFPASSSSSASNLVSPSSLFPTGGMGAQRVPPPIPPRPSTTPPRPAATPSRPVATEDAQALSPSAPLTWMAAPSTNSPDTPTLDRISSLVVWRDRLYMYGGPAVNDLWTYEEGRGWQVHATAGTAPEFGAGRNACVWAGKMAVYTADPLGLTSDIAGVLTLDLDTLRWTQLWTPPPASQPRGTYRGPPSRGGQACCVTDGGELILVGGYDMKGDLSDAYALRLDIAQWRRLADCPVAVCGHFVFFYEGTVYLKGDRGQGANVKHHIFSLDLLHNQWSAVKVTGTGPVDGVRTVSRWGRHLYVVSESGWTAGEDEWRESVNDVYRLDLTTMVWELCQHTISHWVGEWHHWKKSVRVCWGHTP